MNSVSSVFSIASGYARLPLIRFSSLSIFETNIRNDKLGLLREISADKRIGARLKLEMQPAIFRRILLVRTTNKLASAEEIPFANPTYPLKIRWVLQFVI